MTPRWRSSRSLEPLTLAALAASFALVVPRVVRAQACCAGGAVVSPARLALHEDWAAGLQLRARSNQGSFDPQGRFLSSTSGDVEQVFEQDFAASVRFLRSAQAGVVIPMLQTHRNSSGIDDWGGGLGDLSLTARYDFLLAAQSLYWPGFGLLAACTIPTGTPPDRASHPLSADATGAGTFDVTLGLAVEKVAGHFYAAFNGWVTHRFDRTAEVAGVALSESFSARWSALLVAGYVFDSEAALGAYISTLTEGTNAIDGAEQPSTGLRLTTVGVAGVLPIRDVWRVQGSFFSDVMISRFGRNEQAGFGATAALVRVWL
jgi:hypothetical protein